MAKVMQYNKLILFNQMIKNNNNKQVFFLNDHDDMDKKTYLQKKIMKVNSITQCLMMYLK